VKYYLQVLAGLSNASLDASVWRMDILSDRMMPVGQLLLHLDLCSNIKTAPPFSVQTITLMYCNYSSGFYALSVFGIIEITVCVFII
jgi:hypothetical protein